MPLLSKNCNKVTNRTSLMSIQYGKTLEIINIFWRDCVGIEPTRPGTQVSGSFEDYEGHQYPIQPRRKERNSFICNHNTMNYSNKSIE